MKKESIEKIMELFEKDRIYVIRNLKLRNLAEITGEDAHRMERDFETEFGYSFREMLSIWRICHARDLLMSGKVPYRLVWKFSGYKSIKEFERECDSLVI